MTQLLPTFNQLLLTLMQCEFGLHMGVMGWHFSATAKGVLGVVAVVIVIRILAAILRPAR